jgi:GNAT superfamily N-acetyltransferase
MLTELYSQTPPPADVTRQVLAMVEYYVTDLSMFSIPPSNPLHAIYRMTLACEVDEYIRRIGCMPAAPVELVVAFDESRSGEVVGFLLYLPVPTHPEACGVTYMAVKTSNRGRGLGSLMMQGAIARYPHVELTCPIKKVSFYERLGFKVIDSHITQVVMNTRSASAPGMMGVVNAGAIMESKPVGQLHEQLLARWGRKAMLDAEKQLHRHTAQLTFKAKAYVHERLVGSNETDCVDSSSL